MKIFIVVLGFLALSLSSQGDARPFLRTLVSEHSLTRLAASPWFRYHFPAGQQLPPSLDDYISEKIDLDLNDPIDVREAGAMQKIEDIQKKGNELRQQWIEEFYPEPTDELVLAILGEDTELRAHLVAFLLSSIRVQQRGLQNQITMREIFLHSFGLAMFIRAIDHEYLAGGELQDKLNNFLENNALEFVYVGDGDTPRVPSRQKIFYNGREYYLLRNNHVKHPQLQGEMLNALWQRGYADSKLTAALNPQVADMLLAQNMLPDEEGFFSGYQPNLYFDLLSEPGIIGDFVPSVYEAEAYDLEEVVASELGVEAGSAALYELIVLLNDKSLVQIAQLKRMGYDLEEIRKLTYPTSEAIIVSGHYNRDTFSEQHGTNIDALNEIVAKTGELVFFLLEQGVAKSVAEINPHHVPSHVAIQDAVTGAKQWENYLSGRGFNVPVKVTGLPQGQSQHD